MKLGAALVVTSMLLCGARSADAALTSSERGQIRDFVSTARAENAGKVRSLIARTDLATDESLSVLSEAVTPVPFNDQRAVFLRESGADEAWERDELVKIVRSSRHADLRVAAAQTLGAFAPLPFVLEHLSFLADDPSPTTRAALLWALQLAARPDATEPAAHARAEALVRRALGDADPSVRRRAAYVAGNRDLEST